MLNVTMCWPVTTEVKEYSSQLCTHTQGSSQYSYYDKIIVAYLKYTCVISGVLVNKIMGYIRINAT